MTFLYKYNIYTVLNFQYCVYVKTYTLLTGLYVRILETNSTFTEKIYHFNSLYKDLIPIFFLTQKFIL